MQRYLFQVMTSVHFIFDASVFSMYLFSWRHLEIISDRLFNKNSSSSSRIANFSLRHKLHLFVAGLNGECLLLIFHVTNGFLFLIFQYYVDKVVSCSYCFILNDFLWFEKRFLNVVSQTPL